MIITILLGILAVFLGCLAVKFGGDDEGLETFLASFVLGAVCVTFFLSLSECVRKPKPSAMDVYQGKTTLMKTIVDGAVVDSTVIFIDDLLEKEGK